MFCQQLLVFRLLQFRMSQTIPYKKTIAIVDVETTGGNASNNRLIEIGIIRIENGVEVCRFQSLVQPEQSVPIFVQNLTGISDRDLESAPLFEAIADKVEECLKDALFIGHNVRFDYDFVRHEFRRLGRRFAASTLCSARLSRAFFPEYKRHNLSEIVTRHGLSVSARHRALDDAQAVWDFFRKSVDVVGAEKFKDFFEKLVAGRPAKSLIPEARFKNIPETAGAYFFRDAARRVLYVSRSGNLRERILGHFYGDFENPKEAQLLEQAADLEWVSTPGELSALFLEMELVQKLNPLYSRKTSQSLGMICAVSQVGATGYPEVKLLRENQVRNKEDIFAYYRGFREAKETMEEITKKYNLCRKWMGFEKDHSPCSATRMKQCFGACTGTESSAIYSKRLERALENASGVSWPYPAAILLEEYDEVLGQAEVFVIQNWLILARIDSSSGNKEAQRLDLKLDWNQLKVLKRVLQNENVRIRPLEKKEMQSLFESASK